MSDGKGEAENTDKVVHVFKREGAGMFAPQDVVSITAHGGLTICIAGHCITKRRKTGARWRRAKCRRLNRSEEQAFGAL